MCKFCRETSEDGKEMLFDHGAPFFTVTNSDVLTLVREWESGGLVAEWKVNFGSFNCVSKIFVNIQQVYNNSVQKYICASFYFLSRHLSIVLEFEDVLSINFNSLELRVAIPQLFVVLA